MKGLDRKRYTKIGCVVIQAIGKLKELSIAPTGHSGNLGDDVVTLATSNLVLPAGLKWGVICFRGNISIRVCKEMQFRGRNWEN